MIMNRHARKRKHIDKQKKKFLRNPFMNPGGTYEQYLATTTSDKEVCGCRNLPYCEQYWRFGYVSNQRGYAKEMTNSVLRTYNRNMIAKFLTLDEEDWEDFDCGVGQRNGYQKHFDYAWTVW